jgi:ribosome-associated translation inhibitor RaiA
MRLQIRGKHTDIAPELLGWIAEYLEKLNTPNEDIFEARITLVKYAPRSESRDIVDVQLLLSGQTIHVSHDGDTIEAAVSAALNVAQHRLFNFRASAPRRRQSLRARRKRLTSRFPSLAATGDTTPA